MKHVVALLLALPVLLVLACSSPPEGHDPAVRRISKEDLNQRRGEDALRVVDVRITGDWKESEHMIAGAMRGDPNDVSLWAKEIPKDQTVVLYCS